MKLWSKEALVLGGIYLVLDALSSLLGFDAVAEILFFLFFICAIMLCFNKTPKFISWTINQYPQVSYYLTAIGWIPYFIFIVFGILIGSGYLVDYSDTVLEYIMNIVLYTYETIFLVIASLIIAFIRVKIKS